MEHRRKHSRHHPRSWFSLFLRYGGWVSLILGGFLVMLTLISATQLYIADQLDRDGKFARAVIMDKYSQEVTNSDGETSTQYHAVFRYKDSRVGGQELDRQVTRSYFDANAVGSEVVIRYLRGDPNTFEYEIGQYRREGNAVRWFGLLMGIAGLAMLWRSGRSTNAAIIARRDGEKRVAQVTAIRETGRGLIWRIHMARLVWREEDGQTGESFPHPLDKLSKKYRAGDQIVVFRLGDDVFWEGDVGPPWRDMD